MLHSSRRIVYNCKAFAFISFSLHLSSVCNTFLQFVMQTVLLSVLCFPILLVAVALSRMPLIDLAKTIVIIFSTVLFFRILGFSLFLYFKRWNPLDTIIASVSFFSFFLVTAIVLDYVNPLKLIFQLNLARELVTPLSMDGFSLYLFAVLTLVFLLSLLCQIRAGRKT